MRKALLIVVSLAVAMGIATTAGAAVSPNSPRPMTPEEVLDYWASNLAEVDLEWACKVGSYHHTCEVWWSGIPEKPWLSGDREVECVIPGCDPRAIVRWQRGAGEMTVEEVPTATLDRLINRINDLESERRSLTGQLDLLRCKTGVDMDKVTHYPSEGGRSGCSWHGGYPPSIGIGRTPHCREKQIFDALSIRRMEYGLHPQRGICTTGLP